MRALIKERPGPGARYGESADPSPGRGEVLLKLHRASICGSDLPIYHWTSWAPGRIKVPMVFGHEFCGELAALGPGVRGLKVGDFVSVESHIYCRKCLQCRRGEAHVCQTLKIIGVDGPGGFAERVVVPARCVWRHKGRALRDVGSLFEPFGNAVYSVLVEDVRDKAVLVMGAGPQGLFAAAVARASGARTVVAVEGSRFRAELARRMGARAVVDPGHPDVLGQVLKAGRVPGGFDVVCEMSGSPKAIELGLKAVANGGRLTAFGIPPGKVELDWAQDVIFKGVRIYGIVGRRIFETWELAQKLLDSGRVDLRPAVTHTFALRDYEEGFRVMSEPEKRCGKVLLVP